MPSSMQQDAARKIDEFWQDIKTQCEKEKEARQAQPVQLLRIPRQGDRDSEVIPISIPKLI